MTTTNQTLNNMRNEEATPFWNVPDLRVGESIDTYKKRLESAIAQHELFTNEKCDGLSYLNLKRMKVKHVNQKPLDELLEPINKEQVTKLTQIIEEYRNYLRYRMLEPSFSHGAITSEWDYLSCNEDKKAVFELYAVLCLNTVMRQQPHIMDSLDAMAKVNK